MSTFFELDNLPGITFEAKFDSDKGWMNVAGRNAEDRIVCGAGFAVTRTPLTQSTAAPTPEPIPDPEPEPPVQ